MKISFSLFFIVFYTSVSTLFAQETFKKRYLIKEMYIFPEGSSSDTIFLQKNNMVKFSNWSKSDKDALKKTYPIGAKITTTEEVSINGKKKTITREVIIKDSFYNSLTKTETINYKFKGSRKRLKVNVKFDNDKVYINPWLRKNEIERKEIYFFKLKNRRTLRLPFREWTVNAIAIPLKYRFGRTVNDSLSISEEFTASFNVNVFVGYTFGDTKFFHRKKIGNKKVDRKFTIGAFLGTSTVTLNKNNTSLSNAPIQDNTIKGLMSFGAGAVYSHNKLNFGIFWGIDFGIGSDSRKWNYNYNSWIGIGLGYSLFGL